MKIKFTLNKKKVTAEVESTERLIDLLRNKFQLMGTKEGCSIGECGACTILMDGKAVNSCLVLAEQIEGAEIITIEGIADGEQLHPIQENFIKAGAIQCGFCTPGMVVSSYELLNENPEPNEEEIKEAIAGNLCRCTGYKQIIDAVKISAEQLRDSK
ncbi:MAG: (2Fe-2S)-binding protein [Ignavibacteriae bacterium]|nr:(2Fe-2S)-binding protein [Ignavibacteriota bacterium]NOG96460.1 (2Fe-2S)-binding protein [Ignavibacteriota bacterium]